MARRRLDAELVRRSLARSREHAQELIGSGNVVVNGLLAHKPATQVLDDASVVVNTNDEPVYVSRGAHKLIGALDAFGLEVAGLRCLDAGASTGGFSDVLLRRGAREVVAVDVGYGQLAWSIQSDPRVSVHDRTNIRNVVATDIGGVVDLVVADLSFISLTVVLPALIACTASDGRMLLMVKPQFEVGKERLGSGGVVRENPLRAWSISTIASSASSQGWGAVGVVASPLPGPSGNVEYFLHLRAGPSTITDDDIATAIEEGPR